MFNSSSAADMRVAVVIGPTDEVLRIFDAANSAVRLGRSKNVEVRCM